MTEQLACRLCGHVAIKKFSSKILHKYDVGYYQCETCGLLQTEEPYWLPESYASAINVSDTGIIVRNEFFRRICSVLFFFLFDKNKKFIDYAGGYGIFTRMMRDVGFDYYWDDKYAQNLLARGFQNKPGNSYEALTAFEVFEHLPRPLEDLDEMLALSETIVFSTELLPDKLPEMNWWYYAFDHGQHVSFYKHQTLSFIAQKYQLHLITDGKNFHILTKRKLNPFLFHILKRLSKYGLFRYVAFFMKSKTETDHSYLARTKRDTFL